MYGSLAVGENEPSSAGEAEELCCKEQRQSEEEIVMTFLTNLQSNFTNWLSKPLEWQIVDTAIALLIAGILWAVAHRRGRQEEGT